jgi:lipopolysaccharide transport system permease protein
MSRSLEVILKPRSGWQLIDFAELWSARELFAFLIWRDIKIRYRQTLLGGLWALLQPLLAMLVFTFFFNRLVGVGADGVPYPVFAYTGLLLWTFFSGAVTMSSNSLIGNQVLVSKVYFPRVYIPVASIAALLLDFVIGMVLLAFLLAYYRCPITTNIVWFPIYVMGTMLAASGLGCALSALNVRFRDVKYVVPFLIQMGLFVSPVIYPLSYVPAKYQSVLALNPMVGLIAGFRHSLLGGPVSWEVVSISLIVSVLLFVCGLLLFSRMERTFADII